MFKTIEDNRKAIVAIVQHVVAGYVPAWQLSEEPDCEDDCLRITDRVSVGVCSLSGRPVDVSVDVFDTKERGIIFYDLEPRAANLADQLRKALKKAEEFGPITVAA